MADRVVAPAARVALVAGATGLVGREVLAALLTDRRYCAVHCVGRRPAPIQHAKLTNHVADLGTLTTLPGISHVDDVFIALGTTIKTAGSQAAFRAVDLDAVVAVARAARDIGATRLGVVSAMGADANSLVFYNRVKGEMEDAVAKLGYSSLVVARPSMLDGKRSELAQAARPAEKLGLLAMALLKPLIPADYRAIAAAQVARALVSGVKRSASGVHVLRSAELQSVR
ncbi:MAG: NAD(P)H-binding protein [Rhodoferax sp.]|nr:NAD(P)H-binding protein [Rhodoferax sp.]